MVIKKIRYLILCARRVSGITYIGYAHNEKIGNQIMQNVSGERKGQKQYKSAKATYTCWWFN